MADGAIFGAVFELIGLAVNSVLRAFGYSEVEVKKLEKIVAWSLVSLFIACLLYITVTYS
jgi:hypothetical protein